MTWGNLTATAIRLRAGNEDILTEEEYSDSDLIAIYQGAAKEEMLLDLQGVLGTSDSNAIDDITDSNTVFLQSALAHKQLAIFYRREDAGEGSVNRRRMEYYESKYRADVSGFGRLTRSTGSVARSTTIRR